jgi:hypothetical protein
VGRLTVEVRNRDLVRYHIAWAQALDRLEWSVEPASFGHFVVESTPEGSLLLTNECGFTGSWDVVPGSYSIAINEGIATLTAVASIGSSVELEQTEPCPFQGP